MKAEHWESERREKKDVFEFMVVKIVNKSAVSCKKKQPTDQDQIKSECKSFYMVYQQTACETLPEDEIDGTNAFWPKEGDCQLIDQIGTKKRDKNLNLDFTVSRLCFWCKYFSMRLLGAEFNSTLLPVLSCSFYVLIEAVGFIYL